MNHLLTKYLKKIPKSFFSNYYLQSKAIYKYNPLINNNEVANYNPTKWKIYTRLPLFLGIVILPTPLYFLNPFFLVMFYLSKKFQTNYEERIFNTVKQIDYNPKNEEFQFFIPGKNFFVHVDQLKTLNFLQKNKNESDLVFEIEDKKYFVTLKTQESMVLEKEFFKCIINNDMESIKKYALFK